MLLACREQGMSLRVMADTFSVTPATINRWRKLTGLPSRRPPRIAFTPINDEEWRDLPELQISVSSIGRFRSSRTGALRRTPMVKGVAMINIKGSDGKRHFLSARKLVEETFGQASADAAYGPVPPQQKKWTEDEVAALKRSRSISEACRMIPSRGYKGIQRKIIKLKLCISEPYSGPARGSVPYTNALWAEASAVVPRGLPHDERDDLISDLVLMRLKGRREPFGTLLKEARRERNRVMGAWRERSLDAKIGGADGFTLMDRLDSEGRVW